MLDCKSAMYSAPKNQKQKPKIVGKTPLQFESVVWLLNHSLTQFTHTHTHTHQTSTSSLTLNFDSIFSPSSRKARVEESERCFGTHTHVHKYEISYRLHLLILGTSKHDYYELLQKNEY